MFSNNGGEFASKDFIAFCENFNIEIKTTQQQNQLGTKAFVSTIMQLL